MLLLSTSHSSDSTQNVNVSKSHAELPTNVTRGCSGSWSQVYRRKVHMIDCSVCAIQGPTVLYCLNSSAVQLWIDCAVQLSKVLYLYSSRLCCTAAVDCVVSSFLLFCIALDRQCCTVRDGSCSMCCTTVQLSIVYAVGGSQSGVDISIVFFDWYIDIPILNPRAVSALDCDLYDSRLCSLCYTGHDYAVQV